MLSDEGLRTGPRRADAAAHRARRRHLGRRPGRRPVRRRGRRPAGRAAARRRVRRPRAAAVGARRDPAAGHPRRARRLAARGRRRRCRRPTNRSSPASRAAWAGCRRPSSAPGLFTTRTDATVRELRRTDDAASSSSSAPTRDPETIAADAVVLATPAAPTARLLADLAPAAAAELADDRVRLDGRGDPRLPRDEVGERLPGLVRLPGAARRRPADQGVDVLLRQVGLGPRGRPRRRRRRGLLLLRTSLGRHGEEAALQATDDELVAVLARRPRRRHRPRAPARRQPRAALGRRPPAVRRRPPRPGRADPRRRGPGPRARGLRRGVRRRRHPGRHRVRPAGGHPGRRGRAT